MKTLKVLAVLSWLGLIVFMTYVLSRNPPQTGEELFLTALLYIALITSIYAVVAGAGQTWLGLYFKRKGLEEEQKIERLKEGE